MKCEASKLIRQQNDIHLRLEATASSKDDVMAWVCLLHMAPSKELDMRY